MTEVLTETSSSSFASASQDHPSQFVLHLMHNNGPSASFPSAAPVPSAQQHSNAQQNGHNQVTVVNVDNAAPRSYTILKEVGDGSFGTVWLADWHSPLKLPPGTLPPGPSSRPEYKGKKIVAVKRMKKAFMGGWLECLKLKELHVGVLFNFFTTLYGFDVFCLYLFAGSRCSSRANIPTPQSRSRSFMN